MQALRRNVCGRFAAGSPTILGRGRAPVSGRATPTGGVLGATASTDSDDRLGLRTLAAPARYARDAVGTPLGQILMFLFAGALIAVAVLPASAVPDRRLAAVVSLRRFELATAGLSVLLGVLAVLLLN